jgi:hypothetical protein
MIPRGSGSATLTGVLIPYICRVVPAGRQAGLQVQLLSHLAGYQASLPYLKIFVGVYFTKQFDHFIYLLEKKKKIAK